jgi:hypothetical protein
MCAIGVSKFAHDAALYFLAELRRHIGFFPTVAFWALLSMADGTTICPVRARIAWRPHPQATVWRFLYLRWDFTDSARGGGLRTDDRITLS